MRRRAVMALTAVAVLGVPGVASAHKYKVWAGNPSAPPATAPEQAQINQFLPAKITVRKGDRLSYGNRFIHTVSVLGKDVKPSDLALAVPDTSATYQGINAFDGSPFYFNGQPVFRYNTQVFAPVGTNNVSDRKTHSSGAFTPTTGPVGRFTMKFSRPGKYQVLCLIHPGMKQTVVVRRKGKVDKNSQVARRIAKQARAGFKRAAAAVKTAPTDGKTIFAGVESKNATVLSYYPQSLTVAAGTAVTFKNMSPSEVHNMTFGPEQYALDTTAATDKLPGANGTENQFPPFFIYGSEPGGAPGTPPAYTYTAANGGNGFLETMLSAGAPGTPLPPQETVTFTKAGTYTYFCALHGPSMRGTIIVQ